MMPVRSPEAIARKNAKRRAARAAARGNTPPRSGPYSPKISKTSPEWRRRVSAPQNMTKGELHALLAEAVRNTVGASA